METNNLTNILEGLSFLRLKEGYLIKPFDCEDQDLNEFLFEKAISYRKELLSSTFIIENELYNRQYYTGYCGWVSNNNQALYVNLRCMQITANETFLYVGGGITKDSIPEKEYEETQNKAQTMITIL